MNIYDFDNTIFKGDSSVKFITYSFIRHPFLVLYGLIKAFLAFWKNLFFPQKGYVKSALYSFVKFIPNFDEYVNNFILQNIPKIKKFYLEKKKDDDVIISATYDFIIEPFCQKLGLKNIIATKYDIKEGKLIGKHCKQEEKVKRFKEEFPKAIVKEAYSDSLSDEPMLKLAQKAYLVHDEKIKPFFK